MTVFYPSGKLEPVLAGRRTKSVQGVPCMTAGFIGFILATVPGATVGQKFYESGKLESCTLAKDFGGEAAGRALPAGEVNEGKARAENYNGDEGVAWALG